MIIPARIYWAHEGEAWLAGLPFSSEPVDEDDGSGLWPRRMVHRVDGVLPNPPGMTILEVHLDLIPLDDCIFHQFREPAHPDHVPCYLDIVTRKKFDELLMRIYEIQREGEAEFKACRPSYEAAWKTVRPPSS